MTTIGITGATGMIGTNLVLLLTSEREHRNRYRPVALVRNGSRSRVLEQRGVEKRVVDYQDPNSFAGKLGDLDVLIHLAGLTKAYRARDFYQANTLGTRNLLEAVERYGSGIRHFLYSSSVAACGASPSPDRPKDEQAECVPHSRYGDSKLQAERIVRAAGLDWTILRLPMVLGPHDYEGLRLFRLVRSGLVVTFGRKEDYFSYIFAQDLAKIIVRMILNGSVYGEIVNVSYDGSVRALEFYEKMRQALGLDPKLRLRHLPRWSFFAVGAVAGVVQYLTGRARYVNLDRARDLTRKNFVLCNEKMKAILGMGEFRESGALNQTLQWFEEEGLL
jgi:nucleoside-diphosphate-sugar epimerase